MALKRLEQETQIELATMVAFLEEDEEFLEKTLDKAGVGWDGDYERFKLQMAKYWLKGARDYIEDVVDTWFARDDDDDVFGDREPPMTVITANKTVRVTDDQVKTTYHNVNGKSTEMVTIPVTAVNTEAPTKKEDGKPWVFEKNKPWTPPYKDPDKIKDQVEQILADIEDMKRVKEPGFKGWLAASTTAALGGKSEPAAILKAVNESLEEHASR